MDTQTIYASNWDVADVLLGHYQKSPMYIKVYHTMHSYVVVLKTGTVTIRIGQEET